jgi:hypothetical protein
VSVEWLWQIARRAVEMIGACWAPEAVSSAKAHGDERTSLSPDESFFLGHGLIPAKGTPPMKRIPRNPAKFDVFDLFHSLADKNGFSVGGPRANEQFLDAVAEALRRNKNDRRLIYGKRTESMFGFIAAALGKSAVIRQEDSGETFVSGSGLQPPDYRIVLKDGLEFFVEVKNCHDANPALPFTLSSTYVDRLERYAAAFSKEIKVAIYWSRWNLWSLIGLQRFSRTDEGVRIDMRRAMKYNEMLLLGDYLLATRPPLELRVIADTQKARLVDRAGRCNFTVGAIEIYSGATRIEDPFERQLAFFLMLPNCRPRTNVHASRVRDCGPPERIDVCPVPRRNYIAQGRGRDYAAESRPRLSGPGNSRQLCRQAAFIVAVPDTPICSLGHVKGWVTGASLT